MSHIYHPDLGDPARPAILVDGCTRCAEHSNHPIQNLDKRFTSALWRKMVAVEHHDDGGWASVNERRAGLTLFAIALFLERYTDVDPWSLFA